MTLPFLLAVLNVWLAVPLTWTVAAMLWWQARATPTLRTNKVMQAVALTLGGLAAVETVFSIVFLSNSQATPFLTLEQTQLMTRGTLLIVSISVSLYWLRLYLAKRNGPE